MSEGPENGQEKPPPKQETDAPSRADAIALGIGCLVTLIIFVAIVLVGIARG